MELIVLKGEAHSGKTATINYVYNELIKRNWKEVVPYTEISNGDFLAVLEKNEIRLGIVSQGDYVGEKENSVEKHLESMKKHNCSKVICTVRKNLAQKVNFNLGSGSNQNTIILGKPIEMNHIREINRKVEDILALV
jgi:hypothetical protein